MKTKLMILLLCLLLIVSACGRTEIQPVENEEEPSAAARALSFETVDLEGNAVSSEALFAAHRITMVNVMTTWCKYCIQELPELQRLSETYGAQDCAVIGLLYDGTDDAAKEEGKSLMEQAGASYQVLCPWEGMESQLPVQAFPTTFFVDSTGTIIGETIVGADLEGYTAQLDALLTQTED